MSRPDASTIVVPGSISNLGPGFDALSVAVSSISALRIVDVVPGRAGHASRSSSSARRRSARTGSRRRSVTPGRASAGRRPACASRSRSDIPMRAGLGSSARRHGRRTAAVRSADRAAADAAELLALASRDRGPSRQRRRGAARRPDRELPVRRRPRHGARVALAGRPAVRGRRRPEVELETAHARQVLPADRHAARRGLQPAAGAAARPRARDRATTATSARRCGIAGTSRPARRSCPGWPKRSPSTIPAVLGVCLSGSARRSSLLAGGPRRRGAARSWATSTSGSACRIRSERFRRISTDRTGMVQSLTREDIR